MAHLAYGHCGDAAMQLIAQAPELYEDVLADDHVRGMRGQCEGYHLAGQAKRNQELHQGKLVGRVTTPGESLHADVDGPIVPMGIGKAKYILVVVDECTRYSWVFPMRKKAQAARLLALLIQRINTQIRRPGEPGVRRLHTDQGGEFKSTSLEEFCQWKGIVHTCTERAQHQSTGQVERKIGQLNESTRAALLASDLPAYLWPEVYMAMCHTQNIVPSSALQPELKKEKKEQSEKKVKKDGEEGSTPGEQGDAGAQAAAESLEVHVRDMIPYSAFHRDTSDEYFKQLVGLLKPWGVPVFVYHRRDNKRHLETRSQKGFYMGPASGPSMDRVFLKNGGTGTVKQVRHVLVPPAFAQ